jgi:GT2 family glycosyltransferase
MTPPAISLIVPTRRRVRQLHRLVDSLAETAARPDAVEVVLVVDEDDTETQAFRHDGLPLKTVVVPCGLPMGALNLAGYDDSAGRCVMLLNDDVAARTPRWDERVLECFAAFPDDVLLVHVNDLLFGEALCTFPLVSRTYCELAGGVCPGDYRRYRIDDHIGDVFNLLGLLGERRIVYLPEVVFEHFHYVEPEHGQRRYAYDEAVMGVDAPRFEDLRGERQALTLRLKEHIDEHARRSAARVRRQVLGDAGDPFALRTPGRLRVVAEAPDPARARVAVGVAAGRADPACLDAFRTHAPGAELIVLESGGGDFRPGREWNRLLQLTRADYLVLTDGRSRLGPGCLPRLLAALRGGAIAATPLHLDEAGRPLYAGLAAWPEAMAPAAPRPLLAATGGLALLDVGRARALLFDERYQRWFADLDFGLRAWEAGWRVVCAPQALATRLAGLDAAGPSPLEAFDADRTLFVREWEAAGRLRLLDERLTAGVRELRRLLELGPEAARLLQRGRREGPAAYRLRAARLFADLQHYPILPEALAAAAAFLLGPAREDITDPQTGHLAWLLALARRPVVVEGDGGGYSQGQAAADPGAAVV